jgi:hypothetical protein
MDKNRITQSVILSLTTLAAAASWFWLKNALVGEGNWFWLIGGFFIFLICLGLGWLMVKSKTILLTTLSLVLVSFLFSFDFRLEYLAVLIIAGLFFLFGSWRALNEKGARIKIQYHKILRRGLPSVLTGLALIIATAYYFSPLALESHTQIQIPRSWFNLMIKPMMGTIEEQLQKNIQTQMGQQIPVEVQALIPQISQQFELELEGNEDLEDVLYQLVNQQINKFSQPYQQYFPLGLAIGFFFALKAISIPLMWLVVLSSCLIFRILVVLGAVKITQKAVFQEEIEI